MQSAQDAETFGRTGQLAVHLLADARCVELFDGLPVATHDGQGAVARLHQCAALVDDLL